jgi:hypothetical protein
LLALQNERSSRLRSSFFAINQCGASMAMIVFVYALTSSLSQRLQQTHENQSIRFAFVLCIFSSCFVRFVTTDTDATRTNRRRFMAAVAFLDDWSGLVGVLVLSARKSRRRRALIPQCLDGAPVRQPRLSSALARVLSSRPVDVDGSNGRRRAQMTSTRQNFDVVDVVVCDAVPRPISTTQFDDEIRRRNSTTNSTTNFDDEFRRRIRTSSRSRPHRRTSSVDQSTLKRGRCTAPVGGGRPRCSSWALVVAALVVVVSTPTSEAAPSTPPKMGHRPPPSRPAPPPSANQYGTRGRVDCRAAAAASTSAGDIVVGQSSPTNYVFAAAEQADARNKKTAKNRYRKCFFIVFDASARRQHR